MIFATFSMNDSAGDDGLLPRAAYYNTVIISSELVARHRTSLPALFLEVRSSSSSNAAGYHLLLEGKQLLVVSY